MELRTVDEGKLVLTMRLASLQRERGGLDPPGRGGVPPDAGQIWPRCDALQDRDLSVVPLAASLELMTPPGFAEA